MTEIAAEDNFFQPARPPQADHGAAAVATGAGAASARPTGWRRLIARPAPGPRPLRLLIAAATLYSLFVALFFAAAGQDTVELLRLLIASIPSAFTDFFALGGVVSVALLPAVLLLPQRLRERVRSRLGETCIALVFANLMFVAFAGMKLTLPQVIPFHADRLLAELDAALHFGIDPWRITHAVLGGAPMGLLARIYLNSWALPAMYLPVLMALFETDDRRRAGFTWLWLACWVLLGTLLAGAVMSGGPVYHDRLVPEAAARFAGLTQRLAAPDAAALADLQNTLWQTYLHHQALIGSGISAFPSVHVGLATVFALYLNEILPRRRVLGLRADRLVPLALLAFFQVLSVHLGWHYAIDGYAAIVLIGGLAWWLRRGPWAGRQVELPAAA